MKKYSEDDKEEDFSYKKAKDDEELPIYKYIPEIRSKFQRIKIVDDPTPVHELENTSIELKRQILIKRDDLTNFEFGGNKARKYEWILGDILKRKNKIVTTIGGLGSNHCFGFAMFAERFGINVRLYLLDQPILPEVKDNVLRRFHPHQFLEPGASDNLGILGYVNAGFEYFDQVKSGICEEVDYIYMPLGTCGTAIGLLIGLELAFGRGKGPKIVGVSVLDSFVNKNWKIRSMCKNAVKFLQKKAKGGNVKIRNIHEYVFERLKVKREYVGIEYGHPTVEGVEAIQIVKNDNIELDQIYTSKAFSCLVDDCRNGEIKEGEKVMFWMTKNSADLSKYLSGRSGKWENLPKEFHKLFRKKGSVKPSKLKKE